MTTRILYVLRHAQHRSEHADPRRSTGSLTRAGRRQASLTAGRLRGVPLHRIVTSTLARARQTAAIVARNRGVLTEGAHLLREVIPCVPHRYPERLPQLPRGELLRDRRQAERAFRKYFRRSRAAERHELLVSHGNLIRYFVCRVLGAPPEAWASMRINNCSLTQFVVKGDGAITLVCFNDVGHLPADLVT